MPRKAKDEKNIKSEEEVKEKKKTTKSTSKSNTSKKASTATTTKSAKTSTKKASTKASKSTTTKKTSKADSKEKVEKTTKKTTKKSTSSTTKKTPAKRTKKIAEVSNDEEKAVLEEHKVEIVEYYDLPYRYNQTAVKILAQTPNVLFVYWDIADIDRKNFINQYGNDFFNNTVPVLLVINKTMNYSYEVEINDFANSWYLHVNDANCEYKVELGRRTKVNSNYYYITTSNNLNMPNDHILFNNIPNNVLFKNVKTQELVEKPITTIKFFKEFAKTKDFYNYFKKLLNDELSEDGIKLTLPSSHTSSSFK